MPDFSTRMVRTPGMSHCACPGLVAVLGWMTLMSHRSSRRDGETGATSIIIDARSYIYDLVAPVWRQTNRVGAAMGGAGRRPAGRPQAARGPPGHRVPNASPRVPSPVTVP